MNYGDYEAMVQKLTTDNAPEIITSMLSAVKDDLAERDAFKKTAQEQDDRIRNLQDTNTQLTLRITGKADMDNVEEQTEEEKIEAMSYDEYINYLKERKGEK